MTHLYTGKIGKYSKLCGNAILFYLLIHVTRAMIFNSSLKMLLPHTSDFQIVAANSFYAG